MRSFEEFGGDVELYGMLMVGGIMSLVEFVEVLSWCDVFDIFVVVIIVY